MKFIKKMLSTRSDIKNIRKRVRSIESRLKRAEKGNRIHQYAIYSMSEALRGVTRGSICIDCGAHQGLISEVFLGMGATVYAFEPNHYMYNYLRFRLSDSVRNGSLHALNNAVWDRKEEIKLYLRDDFAADTMLDGASESSSILVEKTQDNIKYRTSKDKFVSVESIDLCEFIESLGKEVHILKLDVEGAEFDILLKLIESGIYKNVRHMFVETHEEKIPELKEKSEATRRMISEKGITNIDLDWH
jgi:FkbM family methyltransferase